MGQFFVVRDEFTLKAAQQTVAELFAKHGWLKLTPTTEKRSLDANALSHVWYGEIARQRRDNTTYGYRCICKLHHGVPILRRDNDEFRAFYDRFFKQLSYEEKLQAVGYLEISRLFDKQQMAEYMKEIQNTYQPMGVVLSNAKEAAGI